MIPSLTSILLVCFLCIAQRPALLEAQILWETPLSHVWLNVLMVCIELYYPIIPYPLYDQASYPTRFQEKVGNIRFQYLFIQAFQESKYFRLQCSPIHGLHSVIFQSDYIFGKTNCFLSIILKIGSRIKLS